MAEDVSGEKRFQMKEPSSIIYVSKHIRLQSQKIFVILWMDFHAVGATLGGAQRNGKRESIDIL